MNGNNFSLKAPRDCSKKFATILKGKSLPEDMFSEYSLFLEIFWGRLYTKGVATQSGRA